MTIQPEPSPQVACEIPGDSNNMDEHELMSSALKSLGILSAPSYQPIQPEQVAEAEYIPPASGAGGGYLDDMNK